MLKQQHTFGGWVRASGFLFVVLLLTLTVGMSVSAQGAGQDTQKVLTNNPGPAAAACVALDFDALPAGTILTQQGDVTFTVQQGAAGKVILYPSSAPNANWPADDLNLMNVGNVIIFPVAVKDANNDGLADPADNDSAGGKLLITFGAPRLIQTMTFGDDEQGGEATVQLYGTNGLLSTVTSPKTGNATAKTVTVNVDNVTSMLWTTNATTNLKFTSACSASTAPTNTPVVPPTNTPALAPTSTPVVVPNAVLLNPGGFIFVLGANCTVQASLVDAFTEAFTCGAGTAPSPMPSRTNFIYLPPEGSVTVQGSGCTLNVQLEPNANVYYLECSAAAAPTDTPAVFATDTPAVPPVFTPTFTPTAEAVNPLQDYINRVIALTNQYRQQNGCNVPLVENTLLERAAQKHSDWMSAHNTPSHFEPPPDDNNPPLQRVQAEGYPTESGFGENVAFYYSTPETVVAAWYNDPPHRENMLNCSWVAIGVGYANNYWTQDLGADPTGNVAANQPTSTPTATATIASVEASGTSCFNPSPDKLPNWTILKSSDDVTISTVPNSAPLIIYPTNGTGPDTSLNALQSGNVIAFAQTVTDLNKDGLADPVSGSIGDGGLTIRFGTPRTLHGLSVLNIKSGEGISIQVNQIEPDGTVSQTVYQVPPAFTKASFVQTPEIINVVELQWAKAGAQVLKLDLGCQPGLVVPTATPTSTQIPTTDAAVTFPPCGAPNFDWLGYVNGLRTASGLPAVTENKSMTLAACYHSRYMAQNDTAATIEDPNKPGYTIEGDAVGRTGYLFTDGTTSDSDQDVMDKWFNAPFHALTLLSPDLSEVGFASVRDSSGAVQTAATLAFNTKPIPSVTFPVYFPPNGGTAMSLQYEGNENPDPLVNCQNFSAPTGPALILELDPSNGFPNVTASSLTDGTNPLAHCYVLGSHPVSSVIVMPKAPLQAGKTYTVSMTVNGRQYSWTFHTAGTAPVAPTNTPVVAPTLTPTPVSSGSSLSADQTAALAYLNGIRQQMGLPAVTVDSTLSANAVKHAHYLLLNAASVSQSGDYHSEDASKPGYTAEGEAVAGNSDIDPTCFLSWTGPMKAWLGAPLHTIPLIDPSLDSIGLGYDAAGQFTPPCAYVLGFHFKFPQVGPYPVYYPPPNGTHQLLAWDQAEGPIYAQFGKNCTGNEQGPAVFLKDADYIQLADVTSASFAQGDTATNGSSCVGVYFNWIYLMPPNVLTPGQKYTVSITSHNKPYTWSFTAP